MKIHVLLLAGCIAITTVASAQNDPAPTAPAAPVAPVNPAPQVPAKDTPERTPTNAPTAQPAPATPTAPAPAEVNAAAVQPASSLSTNAPLELARTNAAAELVPLIVIDDVPLIDAVKNLSRQGGAF